MLKTHAKAAVATIGIIVAIFLVVYGAVKALEFFTIPPLLAVMGLTFVCSAICLYGLCLQGLRLRDSNAKRGAK
ncbi:hypothetical protein [Rhizobium sp. BK251]|uniref:hypothetical protein n=1 Tax=Rhizobium sp. BK251 TaxID=2512125 RepID=UPI001046A347|nr:hypothetical protein [Rhizobium sp. BK251]TCL70556.1 hypothetical protein EV286_107431 [Rhizobium sp. BK251]